MLLITIKSRENSNRQYSPKYTKEENIIGGKEKTVSPDTVLKNYWNGNEEFADLFNAVLFGGSQVIKPYELENEDTEASVLLEHRAINDKNGWLVSSS